MCGRNYHFARLIAFAYKTLLKAGDAFKIHLYAKVAPCHHYAVARLQYFIKVFYALQVFYFGNKLDIVAAVIIHKPSDSHHILAAAHEGSGYVIHILLDAKENVLFILLVEHRHFQMH